jgi:hypothetical protein
MKEVSVPYSSSISSSMSGGNGSVYKYDSDGVETVKKTHDILYNR